MNTQKSFFHVFSTLFLDHLQNWRLGNDRLTSVAGFPQQINLPLTLMGLTPID